MAADVSQRTDVAWLMRLRVVPPVSLARAAWLATVLVWLAACAPADDRITVMAASSLQDVLPRVLSDHQLTKSVRVSYAASSTLALQLEAGAPGDIFLSANTAWVDRLIAADVLQRDARSEPIGNRLVLVAPRDAQPVTSADPADLLRSLPPDQRLALGDPAHVPAGLYARETLRDLDLWESLASRCAFADNVRAALALVARGESALGIVYATDAVLEDDVIVVAQFAVQPERIAYSFALHTNASADARAVFADLTSDRAMTRFVEAGFSRR